MSYSRLRQRDMDRRWGRDWAPAFFNADTARLAHPFTWMIAGTLVFLVAWLYPPRAYQALMGDRSVIFLHQKTFIFNAASIIAIVLGFIISLGGRTNVRDPAERPLDPLRYAPLTATVAILGLTLLHLVEVGVFLQKGGVGLIVNALMGRVNFSRELGGLGTSDSGHRWLALLLPSSLFFPIVYQRWRSQPENAVVRWQSIAFTISFILAALLFAKRNYLMRPLFGVLLVYVTWPSGRRVTLSKGLLQAGLLGIVGVVLFLLLGVLRHGIQDTSQATYDIFRYVFAPYNAEALVVSDVLVLPGSRTGYYWTEWIWQFPILDDALHLQDRRAYWFGSAAPAGALDRASFLRPYGITTGTALPAFACSYVDFGWFGIFPFFITGLLGGMMWRSFLHSGLTGLLFYPMAAYSFAEWRGNLLFPPATLGYYLLLWGLIGVGMLAERGPSSLKRGMRR